MGDNDPVLMKDMPFFHEWLCPACAHRDHDNCKGACEYCRSDCQCICRRWRTPIPVENE